MIFLTPRKCASNQVGGSGTGVVSSLAKSWPWKGAQRAALERRIARRMLGRKTYDSGKRVGSSHVKLTAVTYLICSGSSCSARPEKYRPSMVPGIRDG